MFICGLVGKYLQYCMVFSILSSGIDYRRAAGDLQQRPAGATTGEPALRLAHHSRRASSLKGALASILVLLLAGGTKLIAKPLTMVAGVVACGASRVPLHQKAVRVRKNVRTKKRTLAAAAGPVQCMNRTRGHCSWCTFVAPSSYPFEQSRAAGHIRMNSLTSLYVPSIVSCPCF
jgi:hypothetical protein